ncbi:MAG: hypothetical protein QNJ63_24340 [Calothrix sp. MO_192.B10]|nr:hypothetical protein [Calothrix sp. MO_192.B10]
MSAKSKILVIVILGIFATVATGLRLGNHQPSIPIDTAKHKQQQNLPVAMPVRNVVANPEQVNYVSIPLDSIQYSLQGSDPAGLAMNAFYNRKFRGKTRKVEVVYPQPNQALVTITRIKPVGDTVEVMKYRARLSSFGRSLLVSSPPLWEIVWAGYQRQCWDSPAPTDVKTISVNSSC